MYQFAIFTNDDNLAQKISRAVAFLNCKIFRFPVLLSNHQAGFLLNFDLIFVHKEESNLETHTSIQKTANHLVPAQAIAFFSDSQSHLATQFLDMGFDRCFSESFDEEHLAAIVRALLRRSVGLCSTVSFYGDLEFNHTTKVSSLKSKALQMPLREALILGLLLRKVGKIVPTEEFVAEIDPFSNGMNKSAIHAYVHRLRNRISSNILPIRNIKRNGYFLNKYIQHVHLREANTIFGNLHR